MKNTTSCLAPIVHNGFSAWQNAQLGLLLRQVLDDAPPTIPENPTSDWNNHWGCSENTGTSNPGVGCPFTPHERLKSLLNIMMLRRPNSALCSTYAASCLDIASGQSKCTNPQGGTYTMYMCSSCCCQCSALTVQPSHPAMIRRND